MRKITTLILLMTAVMAVAQDFTKMSRDVRRMAKQTQRRAIAQDRNADERQVLMLVQGEEEAIRPYSIRHSGDIHIASVPVGRLAALSEDPRIRRMETSFKRFTASMDSTARVTGADRVNAGSALPQAFDGTGVLVGNIDVAYDYSHPTFRSTIDGRERIVRVWDILDTPNDKRYDSTAKFPLGTLLTDTADILRRQHSVDAELGVHGTHTAAISSGSGWGSPYTGIAPESELYLVAFPMTDNKAVTPEVVQDVASSTLMALATENIFSYADSIGRPCVVNFSAGMVQDMTTDDKLYNAYLKRISGPGKVITAAAGNNGFSPLCHISKGKDDSRAGGMLSTYANTITLNVTTQGTLTLRVRNTQAPDDPKQTRDIKLDFKPGNTAAKSPSGLRWQDFTIFKDNDILDGLTIEVYSDEDGFDSSRTGYDIFITDGRKEFAATEYAIELTGDGVSAEAFIRDGQLLPHSDSHGTLAGAQPGGNLISPAALPSVIGVGATAWRTAIKNPEGKQMNYNYGAGHGTRALFSSTGPSLHGLTKPDIAAPGSCIASAMNSYCTDSPSLYDLLTASRFNFDGRQYSYIHDSGTSMSTPVVTGIIALWMQADPTLTHERIMDILATTSGHPDPALPYPNNEYGHGAINAYAGLLKVLNITDIEPSISTRHIEHATVRPNPDGTIAITMNTPTASPLRCRVFSVQGRLLHTVTIPSHSTSCQLTAPLPAGSIAIVDIERMGSTMVRIQ